MTSRRRDMRRLVITCSVLVLSAALVAGSCAANGADSGHPPPSPQGKQLWHESSGTPPAPHVPTSGSPPPRPRRGPGGGSGGEDALPRPFFGQRELPRESRGTSLGSGFIINDEGY